MTSIIDKRLLTHAVVVVGACLGAWMMFVQPQIKGLSAAKAALAANAQAQQEVNEQTFDKAVQRMKDIKSHIAEIERRNSLMHDSSRLYGQIMDLADSHGVTIQNLQPGVEKLSTDTKMTVSRIDLSIDGTFERVSGFLEALSAVDGFIRPVSLNMVPMRDASNPTVIAHFSCEAVSFKLPDALTGIGADHAKP